MILPVSIAFIHLHDRNAGDPVAVMWPTGSARRRYTSAVSDAMTLMQP